MSTTCSKLFLYQSFDHCCNFGASGGNNKRFQVIRITLTKDSKTRVLLISVRNQRKLAVFENSNLIFMKISCCLSYISLGKQLSLKHTRRENFAEFLNLPTVCFSGTNLNQSTLEKNRFLGVIDFLK